MTMSGKASAVPAAIQSFSLGIKAWRGVGIPGLCHTSVVRSLAMASAEAKSAEAQTPEALQPHDSALDFVSMDAGLEFVGEEEAAKLEPAPTRLPLELPSLDLTDAPAAAVPPATTAFDTIEFADTMLLALERFRMSQWLSPKACW